MARRVGRYIVWIAGGDDSILQSIPTERARFNALAATLLFTGFVAAASMFSALFNILKWPLASSITFALLWGFAIFSIDRFMVLTFDRRHGTRRILLIMLPQIAISLLLSAVIAASSGGAQR